MIQQLCFAYYDEFQPGTSSRFRNKEISHEKILMRTWGKYRGPRQHSEIERTGPPMPIVENV